MKYVRLAPALACRSVAYYRSTGGNVQTLFAAVRTLVFPPRGLCSVCKIVDVIDEPNMSAEEMTRVCRDLGISAALSWLASHSADLQRRGTERA